MSGEAIFVLVVAAGAILLFVTEWLAPDVVSLMVLLSLGIGGILDLPTLFSSFGSPVIVTLIGLFMLTTALQHTGVTALISQWLLRTTQDLNDSLLVGVMALSAAMMTLLMNPTASVALTAPIGRRIALKRNLSPSRLLMPVSFGALLGGMATLLTTGNLLVAGLLADRGLPTFQLLDFLPVGGPIALAGLAYLTLFSQRLLPERAPSDQWSGLQRARQELTRTYRLGMRLHEAYVKPDSPLAGKQLLESNLGSEYGVTVSALVRGRRTLATIRPDTRIESGDWLLLQGRPTETQTAAEDLRLELYDPDHAGQALLSRTNAELAEVALSPRSTLAGSTLAETHFRETYGLNVLGIWHEGQPVRSFLSDHRLHHGDGMLVQGAPEQLALLGRDPNFLVLTHLPEVPQNTDRALVSVLILFAFLLTVVLNWLPVSLAALLGGVAAIVTRSETVEQARASINWQVLFLIAGMLALAVALEETGATQWLTEILNATVGGSGPRGLLIAFFVLTMVLAQFTSGQAATLILGPLAISAALAAGISPQPLAMAVAIGATTGFLTPVSHPVNLLVMGPGGYRFSDYSKLGLPLTIIAGVGVYVLAPLFYPF